MAGFCIFQKLDGQPPMTPMARMKQIFKIRLPQAPREIVSSNGLLDPASALSGLSHLGISSHVFTFPLSLTRT
jgi:hypothetical protein